MAEYKRDRPPFSLTEARYVGGGGKDSPYMCIPLNYIRLEADSVISNEVYLLRK
jgi:hypothetical protein